MFEIESRTPTEIAIITKTTTIKFDVEDAVIDAGLAVGKIKGGIAVLIAVLLHPLRNLIFISALAVIGLYKSLIVIV